MPLKPLFPLLELCKETLTLLLAVLKALFTRFPGKTSRSPRRRPGRKFFLLESYNVLKRYRIVLRKLLGSSEWQKVVEEHLLLLAKHNHIPFKKISFFQGSSCQWTIPQDYLIHEIDILTHRLPALSFQQKEKLREYIERIFVRSYLNTYNNYEGLNLPTPTQPEEHL